MRDILTISLGAIAGANARYFLSRYAAKIMGPVFPYGTLVINVSGSVVVGFFMIWATERALVEPRWRLLLVVGFCGAYTTFSTFTFETVRLAEEGDYGDAVRNVGLSLVIGAVAAAAGLALPALV